MHRIAWCAALGILVLTATASATFVASLSTADGLEVPAEGRAFDVTVTLTRDSEDGGNGISAVQMDFVASSDAAFSVELLGVQGSADSTGTGTRYNDAEWDSDVQVGMALDPNLAAGAVTGTPRGPIGTAPLAGLWSTSQSVVAILRVYVSGIAEGQQVTLAPANVLAFPDYETQFDDISGQGVGITFVGVPEPAAASLALLGFGWMMGRRRRA